MWCKGYQPDNMKGSLGGVSGGCYLWGNAISSVRQQMGTKEPPWRFQTNLRDQEEDALIYKYKSL